MYWSIIILREARNLLITRTRHLHLPLVGNNSSAPLHGKLLDDTALSALRVREAVDTVGKVCLAVVGEDTLQTSVQS